MYIAHVISAILNDAFDNAENEKRKPTHCSVIKCHVVIESICHCLWTRSYTIWNSTRLMIHISACSRISSNAMLGMLISEQQHDFANSEQKEIQSNCESFEQKRLKRLSKFNSGDSHHRCISYFSVGNIFYVVLRETPTHVSNIYCRKWKDI